jgi:hypothetical protein
MKVLLLAPQPFLQLRWTASAMKRLAAAFPRMGWRFDILTLYCTESKDLSSDMS